MEQQNTIPQPTPEEKAKLKAVFSNARDLLVMGSFPGSHSLSVAQSIQSLDKLIETIGGPNEEPTVQA